MKRTILLIVVVVLLLIWLIGKGIGVYNTLVNHQESVNTSWANVQNSYQRRADLIPNLVNTVKGYADHEMQTLIGVIEARANATKTTIATSGEDVTPETLSQLNQISGEMNSALSRLLVSVERYPDLKANQNFLELQRQLETTENDINQKRDDFNKTAQIYNTYLRKFPNNIFASILGFKAKPYFEAAPGAENAPNVDFTK